MIDDSSPVVRVLDTRSGKRRDHKKAISKKLFDIVDGRIVYDHGLDRKISLLDKVLYLGDIGVCIVTKQVHLEIDK